MSARASGALADYAAHEEDSRGRRHAEPAPPYRSEYQRDRDRIVHSTAFRRLVYKTQVFVNHEGDLYRTRLTHSLEVAQIARTIARALRLNEVLSEAICLAHDLGHTPFGHAGQDALNACMREFGGFEHNLQSLRVVDVLEEHYAEFDGLNLTFECREGILKHCSYGHAVRLGDVGERFIRRLQPGLEAQLANFADEIAYNNHDVDDGIRAGLISVDQLLAIPLFAMYHAEVLGKYPVLAGRKLVYEILRRMINRLVTDLIDTSASRLAAAGVASAAEVRSQSSPLIGFSDETRELNHGLKTFLREHVYKHYKVQRMTSKAKRVMTALFEAFLADPHLMPEEHSSTAERLEADQGAAGRARAVSDYIAGMTDRYAILEHRRLFDPGERT
ncbi:MAG TPA: deoxyguanosinetriphosphate triphosphohydrolase [Steroidobacteraceae bacterium]|jgi:dGTPase|nr:deoxyguanosinetriphosphate triphosphohydrolase [Steroidobacteraceae bacterium]